MKTRLTLVIALLAAPYLVQPAVAQVQQTGRPEPKQPPHPVHPVETSRVQLSGPPADMPLPMPQGSKFVTGYQTQYATTKPTTFMRLENSFPANQLADWFKSAGKQGGWHVRESNSVRAVDLMFAKSNARIRVELSPMSISGKPATAISVTYNH